MPQLICVGLEGFEVDVTVPLPNPMLSFVTDNVKRCLPNVAVTDRAPVMFTVQTVPCTESQPVQAVNVDPAAGWAFSVTTVPPSYSVEQVDPQLICDELGGFDVEVTVPVPAPAFATDNA